MEGFKIFGFDMDNEFISGFDVGAGEYYFLMAKNDFKAFATDRNASVIMCRRNGCSALYPDLQQESFRASQ